MKYLKFFETNFSKGLPIKHSDPIAIKNPLNEFSRKLEDILIEIKNFDKYDKLSTIRRYFHDNGSIHINYYVDHPGTGIRISNYKGKIFKISLQIINNIILMDIYCYKINKINKINTLFEFIEFININLNEFIVTVNKNNLNLLNNINLQFSLDEKNKILNTLNIFLISKKYNL